MKNQPSQQKTAKIHSYEIVAILLIAAITIPSFVLAQPAANPPGGNVDASFNSITVGPGSFDYAIQPGGGANTAVRSGGNLIFDLNNGLGTLFFQNNVGSTTHAINSSGIWNTAGPVPIVDDIDIQNGISDSTGAV